MPDSNARRSRQKAARGIAFGLLAVCAITLSACDDRPRGPEKVDANAFSFNAPMAAPETIRVRVMNGSITVKPATGGNVSVTAEVRWHGNDWRSDLRFDTQHSADGSVMVCALWGKSTCSENSFTAKPDGIENLFGKGSAPVANFTVYVPTGVRVNAVTINGSVTVAATAPVTARTMNGSIRVATAIGPVDAESVTGDVDVRMTTIGRDPGVIRARTVTGTASAYLPAKFDGDVNLETALGGLRNDFATAGMTNDSKHFTATIGTGGRKVDVGTVTGSAELRKLKADGTVAVP
jgi:hypothetical protein